MSPCPTEIPTAHELHRWARRQRSAEMAGWFARALSATVKALSLRDAIAERLEHGPSRH
jgi:hypothetical protein